MSRSDKNDDVDFQIKFYEGILKKKGDFLETLTALGDLYTRRGMYEKGLEIDKKLSQLRPEDPIILYNLSCSYSLVNSMDASLAAIKRAIDCGYDDLSFLEKDADLNNLRSHHPFQEFFAEIKKKDVEEKKKV